jgi:hypothetical protein
MAHEVRLKLDAAIVQNKDMEVVIKSNDGKIGTLLISRGNIEWRPKGNYVNKKRLTWKKFAELMEKNGEPA